jgi:hypothetical protein
MISPTFDAKAVDALDLMRRASIGYVIEDDDPNPNDIKKLLVTTPLGEWTAELTSHGWAIDNAYVGPKLARMLEFYSADVDDLRQFQGPLS